MPRTQVAVRRGGEATTTKTPLPLPSMARSPGHDESWPSKLADVVPSGGDPLPRTTRQGLESQLHWDLSQVRIHSGEQASRYAAHFGAAAFTVGNHIVLGDRHQRAGMDDAELLRHEATHAVQQIRGGASWMGAALSVSDRADRSEGEARAVAGRSGSLSVTPARPCVAFVKPKNPQIVYSIKGHWARRRVISQLALNPPASKDPKHRENRKDNHYHAMQCVNRIRMLASQRKLPAGKTEEDYYKVLEKLLKTPKALTTGGANPDLRTERIALEAESIFPSAGKNTEEELTASLRKNELPGGQKVSVRRRVKQVIWSKNWAYFTVFLYRKPGEKSWYKRAHIHARIHLEPARKTGKGAAEDRKVINQIKGVVQDVENVAAGRAASGVTFDLELSTSKKGAARFKINASKWSDSGNPWGSAKTMVEEIFHNIGLEDVYDYMSHATTDAYSIHARLGLMLEQLKKYRGTDPKWRPDLPSITKKRASPSDFDYCQVLAVTRAQFLRCMKERGVKGATP